MDPYSVPDHISKEWYIKNINGNVDFKKNKKY